MGKKREDTKTKPEENTVVLEKKLAYGVVLGMLEDGSAYHVQAIGNLSFDRLNYLKNLFDAHITENWRTIMGANRDSEIIKRLIDENKAQREVIEQLKKQLDGVI